MPKDFVDGGVRDFPGASGHPGNTVIRFFGKRNPRALINR
jgi:hypothetical protein